MPENVKDQPAASLPQPSVHVAWWSEVNRFARWAGTITVILVLWSMIGQNVTACIDRSVNEREESERITALEKADAKAQEAANTVELEQMAMSQKIANFEANFSIQTAEIGNMQADVDEIKQDVKMVQRDMRELLLLMADRGTPP